MYNPEEIKEEYEKLEHGKARLAGIKYAVSQADENHDLPYMFYFRMQVCREDSFYNDGMDSLVMFPQVLALADQYPDTPATRFDVGFKNSVDHMLWVYKWILNYCSCYYQIPMEDCLKFFEDFRRRSTAYGYNLRPYYNAMYTFYIPVDFAHAEEYFHKFEELPRDGNCDCKACERNLEIDFYLKKGDLQRAKMLARDIESFRLKCSDDRSAWLRLKILYMQYYMRQKDYREAAKYCEMAERYYNGRSGFDVWDDMVYCYSYLDIGKALRIYKQYWKKAQKTREPWEKFDIYRHMFIFFGKLKEARKKQTIKMPYDSSFPLYNESQQYQIEDLYQYYYKEAEKIAKLFDARNGSSYFMDRLKEE